MLRGRSFAMAFVLLGAMGVCMAQESADIIVGGEIVARVREAGTYESVEHRAAAIDENLNEVLATTDDPGSLEVSLEQVDGLWTILIDGHEIMAVHPAEAEANGLTPEMLGASWVRRFKDALPNATSAPVTVIGEPADDAEPVQPLTIADEPVISSPTTGDEPATDTPTTTTTTAEPETTTAPADTGDTVEILEVPQEDESDPEEIVAGQGARLLILESFNEARGLPEDDYLVRREAMANELFDNLVQVLTGGQARGRIDDTGTATLPTPPTTPTTPPADTEPTTPPTVVETTIDTGPVTPPAETTTTIGPSTVGAAPSLKMSAESRAKIEAQIPEDDPSYANVVQKVAIKAKFRAVSDPYRAALQNDPATAAQAKEVLTAARRAFNDGEFDAAERYLDTGLRLLGVTQWEQHIDAAMTDLGLTG